MIKIYGPPKSRVFRVLWTLEELGVPYENVKVDMSKGEHKTPEFLKLNPLGRVPVLQDDGITLFETSAICCYLAEKFPEKALIPKSGTKERAYFYQWVSYVTTEIEQDLWVMAKHKFVLPEEMRLEKMKEIGAWEFSQHIKALEVAVIGKDFLVGSTFTVADILAGHTLSWAKSVNMPLSDDLERYLKNLKNRSAFQKVRGLV